MIQALMGEPVTFPAGLRWVVSMRHVLEDGEPDEAPEFGAGTARPTGCRSWVMVNEHGMRIGQSHQNAKLSDTQVQQLLTDRGPSDAPRMSLNALAAKYGVSKSGVKGIIDGRRRGQWVARWKPRPGLPPHTERGRAGSSMLALTD